MGGPRVGGWGLVDLDFEDLACSRTFACCISSVLLSDAGVDMAVGRTRT
jgi:hypothetical protein